ncbi:MAG: YIP1 family protein [Verrucomicrobiota bacterium]
MENIPPAENPAPTPPPATSLGARLFNILAAPGAVFEEVKNSPPCLANWMVPIALSILATVLSVFLIFSQESILRQIREQQEQAIEKSLKDMPEAQKAQVRATVEKFSSPMVLKSIGSVSAVTAGVAWPFVVALFVWLAGRFIFKADFPYMKTLEVCSLAGMIGVLGAVLGALLVVGKGTLLASAGPILFVPQIDPTNKVHLTLAACNVMTLWYIAVLAAGLSKLSNCRFMAAFACLFLPWATFKFGLIWLGVGTAIR